jgi:hypothetical protein
MPRPYFLIPFLLASLALAGCSLTEQTDADEVRAALVGEWAWVSDTGGLGGEVRTPATPGEAAYVVRYSRNGRYEVAGGRVGSGRYRIGTRGEDVVVRYEGDRPFGSLVEAHVVQRVSADTLAVWDGLFDGYVSVYARSR